MAKSSLARSGHETNTEIDPRVLRGQRLFRDHVEAFIWKRGTWFVPSENGCGYYCVKLGPIETCECADFEHRGGRCKHIASAAVAQAKSGVCSCCSHRVLRRFLSGVEETDCLLSWFVGDQLCADCIQAGYWS